jgi:hypothetical protein
MAQQKVELRKIRDFSENLNDTFLFIRQNLKPLLASFIAIAGIFMLGHSIISVMFQRNAGGLFGSLGGRTAAPGSGFNYPLATIFSGTYALLLLLAWANFVAMNVAVTCYMKLYDASQGVAPTIEEVWNEFKKYFLKVLVYTIPITLLTMVGFLFCLVPGIYLAVVFFPFATVLIVDDQTFGGAWDRCRAIVKGNFWQSLGIYFLVYLIVAFSAGIISAIVGGVAGAVSYFTTRDILTTISVVTSVLNIFSYVFYIVLYVSVNLHYFNLAERHDGTAIMRKLDTLGGTGGDFDNIQEQY